MKKITTDRKLALNLETIQHLTAAEMDGVKGGARDTSVYELTQDPNEANCTYTTRPR